MFLLISAKNIIKVVCGKYVSSYDSNWYVVCNWNL